MTERADPQVPADHGEVEAISSRRLSAEERLFIDLANKEPVESIARIEEVAKFLVGATATTSGLFLAAFKLALGSKTVSGWAWFVPFLCWALGIVMLVLVLFPHAYPTGRNEPAAWKAAFLQARQRKYRRLFVGTLLFIAGLLSAVYPFAT